MSILVQVPPPMRDAAGGLSEVSVVGATVAEALNDLISKHPALGTKLFDNGKIRPFVNVFVNDEDIRYLDDMDTALAEGVTVSLIPAVAGG